MMIKSAFGESNKKKAPVRGGIGTLVLFLPRSSTTMLSYRAQTTGTLPKGGGYDRKHLSS